MVLCHSVYGSGTTAISANGAIRPIRPDGIRREAGFLRFQHNRDSVGRLRSEQHPLGDMQGQVATHHRTTAHSSHPRKHSLQGWGRFLIRWKRQHRSRAMNHPAMNHPEVANNTNQHIRRATASGEDHAPHTHRGEGLRARLGRPRRKCLASVCPDSSLACIVGEVVREVCGESPSQFEGPRCAMC